jgi:hypothetical protein
VKLAVQIIAAALLTGLGAELLYGIAAWIRARTRRGAA